MKTKKGKKLAVITTLAGMNLVIVKEIIWIEIKWTKAKELVWLTWFILISKGLIRTQLKASKTIAGITFITLLKRLCIMIIKQHAGGCVCKYYNLLRFHV